MPIPSLDVPQPASTAETGTGVGDLSNGQAHGNDRKSGHAYEDGDADKYKEEDEDGGNDGTGETARIGSGSTAAENLDDAPDAVPLAPAASGTESASVTDARRLFRQGEQAFLSTIPNPRTVRRLRQMLQAVTRKASARAKEDRIVVRNRKDADADDDEDLGQGLDEDEVGNGGG